MADELKDAKLTPAMQYSVMMAIARHMEAQALALATVVERLDDLLALFTQAGDQTTAAAASATSNAAPPAGAPAPAASAPPAAKGGFEATLEKLLARRMGLTPEQLRNGEIDDAVVEKLMDEAIAKNGAAAPPK